MRGKRLQQASQGFNPGLESPGHRHLPGRSPRKIPTVVGVLATTLQDNGSFSQSAPQSGPIRSRRIYAQRGHRGRLRHLLRRVAPRRGEISWLNPAVASLDADAPRALSHASAHPGRKMAPEPPPLTGLD
jgi:hypothetical protein